MPTPSGLKVPHVLVLLTGVILICSLLTYIVPSGEYQREVRDVEGHERTLLVPGTYEQMEKHFSLKAVFLGEKVEGKATPVGLHGFLTAIPRGLEARADIIFFIFLVGGVFGIFQRTGVIAAAIGKLLGNMRGSGALLTMALMTVLAAGGSTLGMGEEFIPLVPVFMLVSRQLGYDRIFGLALVLVAAEVGFAASTTNPFTVAVAQSIAEVPLQSGMLLRIVFLVCALAIALVYLLRYGARVKADPDASLMAGHPDAEITEAAGEGAVYRRHHTWILVVCAAIFVGIMYGMKEYGWWMADMGGGFLLMGIAAAALARVSVSDTIRAFVQGMGEMVVAALVVGWAYGIAVVMQDGAILDTIVHGAATLLSQVPRYLAVLGMLGYESVLNFFIPSGSGQAAVSMPLMAPLADLLGLTRQTAVFAFTCGDGFSNTIIPTSGILMAMLGLAKVPYARWLKFMLPLWGLLMGLSAVFLVVAVVIGYR